MKSYRLMGCWGTDLGGRSFGGEGRRRVEERRLQRRRQCLAMKCRIEEDIKGERRECETFFQIESHNEQVSNGIPAIFR